MYLICTKIIEIMLLVELCSIVQECEIVLLVKDAPINSDICQDREMLV